MPEALRSKRNLDRVESINKKPSDVAEGQPSENSDSGESVRYESDSHIVSDAPNLYKHYGVSMSQDFRKYIVDGRGPWLRANYPNCFLVLSYASEIAIWNRATAELDGLEIGDAIISVESAAKACGLTYDQTRTAFEKLEEKKFWETVVLTSKTKNIKKRPIKIPLVSRVVNIPVGDVWDVTRNQNPIQNPIPIPFQSHSNPIIQDSRDSKESYKSSSSFSREREGSSFFEEEENLNFPFSEEDVSDAFEYFKSIGFSVREEPIRRWMAKYDKEVVYHVSDLMKESKKDIKKPEGFLAKALNKDWAKLEGNRMLNQKAFQEFDHPQKDEICIMNE